MNLPGGSAHRFHIRARRAQRPRAPPVTSHVQRRAPQHAVTRVGLRAEA